MKEKLIEFQNDVDHWNYQIKQHERDINFCKKERDDLILDFLKEHYNIYEGCDYLKGVISYKIGKMEINGFHEDHISICLYGYPYKINGEVSKKRQWIEYFYLRFNEEKE